MFDRLSVYGVSQCLCLQAPLNIIGSDPVDIAVTEGTEHLQTYPTFYHIVILNKAAHIGSKK